MHPTIFNVFEQICGSYLPPAARVLEIGAMPQADTLLNLPALRTAAVRVGVNLVRRPLRLAGTSFVQVAADGLAAFADSVFDAVLCNSVLEHDPEFWHTLKGIRRVAKPGAFIVIGVPGYADLSPPPLLRLARRAARVPLLAGLMERAAPGWASTTQTLAIHNYPGDYYRFSPQCVREVLLAHCRDVSIRVEMRPPRIIAFGWRV